MRFAAIAMGIASLATTDAAQAFPLRVPASGGEVILPTAGDKRTHDLLRYATARRVGDMLYVSGVVVFRGKGEGDDVAAFKAQSRRGMERIKGALTAAGVTFQDVVMINSFHVWQGPNFAGDRDAQFAAFDDVVGEYIQAPYPAWTAVGTTGLLVDTGIVEVQMIAHVPAKK